MAEKSWWGASGRRCGMERKHRRGLAKWMPVVAALLLTGLVCARGVGFSCVCQDRVLRQSCRDGDGFGCFYYAREVEKHGERERAQGYYELACRLNARFGCEEAGIGIIESDKVRAMSMWERGCAASSGGSCLLLGEYLLEEAGDGEQLSRAGELLLLACEANESCGCFALGKAMERGLEFSAAHGPESVRSLRQRACARGVSEACSQRIAPIPSTAAPGD